VGPLGRHEPHVTPLVMREDCRGARESDSAKILKVARKLVSQQLAVLGRSRPVDFSLVDAAAAELLNGTTEPECLRSL
jgi:hypothetical protein